MTSPVIAPPAILTDQHGLRWVFSGMTDLGPAYLPQQTPLPMIAAQPAHAPMPWETVTASVITCAGEGE
jgi:hypothetical protein